MHIIRLQLQCKCGGVVVPNALYATPTKDLFIEGFCVHCTNQVHIQYPLSEIYKLGLKLKEEHPEPKLLPEPKKGEWSEEDNKLLHEMHIALPNTEEGENRQ